MPGLIEAVAAERPAAPAVTFGATSITYAELNRAADRLADQIAALSVGRGDFVPLVMRNGTELPVAMLAAMKLAAPFVPVDDAAPPHVRDRMISALSPKLLLSSLPGVPSASVPCIRVDLAALLSDDAQVADDARAEGSHRQRRGPDLDDLVYGFYTTGSTGAPKCALNLHRGLLNRFSYMSRRFGSQGDEVVLQNSRHAFDSSLWQLLWPLTTGGQVIIPDRAGLLDLQVTADVIERFRVTMTDFVPSIFNTLVAMMLTRPDLTAQLTSLRRVLIGGEEATADAVRQFRALLPEVSVVNTYGPTEASIGSVFHEIADADTGAIPIGAPIDNTYVVIVDDRLRPAGPGQVGEILLGGECLGLGYVNDPARTAGAFIANPFPEIPGSRLYRTGDLGRYLPDGLLGFAGRTDQQVKIAGVRVELPEIELALQRHPLVHEAKVIVRDGAGGKWLVAFVTGASALAVADLRLHAGRELSPALVPKEFIVLDRMPLNANGKADRLELARLAERDRLASADVELAANQVLTGKQRLIWEAWRDLLPVPPSSVTDDFFDLGGDSLSAQRLALRLTRGLGAPVTVGDIADRTTIAAQAALGDGVPAAHQPSTRIELDARLPANIGPGPARQGPRRHVLLTGATGFVGAHLLHDLLSLGTAKVTCLVRDGSNAGASDRVRSNLIRYRLWREEFAGRVRTVAGDLGQPGLGLDAGQYQRLCLDIDTVVHNAAMVNLVSGYAAHRAANVSGTIEILRFAAAGRGKPVHYVSTLAAIAEGTGTPAAEAPASAPPPSGGYRQSKWVAERLMDQAAERGMTVACYRLGEIMPHSLTGVPSRRGLPDLLAKACLRVSLCFSSQVTMNYTPVDYASRLVVTAVARGEAGYFHVRHPDPVSFDDLLDVVARECDLPRASYGQFWKALCAQADAGADGEEVLGVLALVPRADEGAEAEAGVRLAGLFGDDLAPCSTDRTDRLMAETGMRWPRLGDEIFLRYASYLRASMPNWGTVR